MIGAARLRTLFRDKPNVRAFGTNFGWLVADKLTRFLVAIFVSAWVARYLGPARYGVLAYGIAFISMFQAIALLGLDNVIVRDAAAEPTQAHRLLGTALRLRMAGATVAYGAMVAVAYAFHRDDGVTTAVVALAGVSVFFQVSDVVDLWFQSQMQSRRTVIVKTSSYLVTAALKVFMITSGAGLLAFAGANAIETGLAAVALTFAYRRFHTQVPWHWDGSTARALLQQSWPLLLSGVAILLYMRVSVVILREFADDAAVGIYTVGATLSEMWYFIPMAMASSIAPIISRKRVEGGDAYKRALFKTFAGMWGLSIVVASVNALTARYWVEILYGHQYRDSAGIFALHSLTFVPVCLGVAQSIWLINEGRSRLALYQAVAGAVVALGLNLLLTPRFGAHGAAASTVISQFVQAFLVNAALAPDLFRLQVRSMRLFSAFKS